MAPKPLIDYHFQGDKNSEVQITADGNQVAVIPAGKDGWTSCWQENTLYEVQRKCQEIFPEGFILPYYVDQGSGYVYKK